MPDTDSTQFLPWLLAALGLSLVLLAWLAFQVAALARRQDAVAQDLADSLADRVEHLLGHQQLQFVKELQAATSSASTAGRSLAAIARAGSGWMVWFSTTLVNAGKARDSTRIRVTQAMTMSHGARTTARPSKPKMSRCQRDVSVAAFFNTAESFVR